MLPSNYYRAAKIYLRSNDKLSGLMYGEIFMNIERTTSRTKEMSELLYEGYKNSLIFVSQNEKETKFCPAVIDAEKYEKTYKFLENNLSLEPYEYFGEISNILGYRIKQAILYFNADILMRVELKYKGDIVLNLKSKLEESQLNFSSIMFLKLYFNQEENLSVLIYQKKTLTQKVID